MHDVAPVAISMDGKHAANSSSHVLTRNFLISPAYNSNTNWLNSPHAALHGVISHHHHPGSAPAPTGATDKQSPSALSPTSSPAHHEHEYKPKVSVVVVLTLLDKIYDVVSGDVTFKVYVASRDRFSDAGEKASSHHAQTGAPTGSNTAGQVGLRASQFDTVSALAPSSPQRWAAGNTTYDNVALFIDGVRSQNAGPCPI